MNIKTSHKKFDLFLFYDIIFPAKKGDIYVWLRKQAYDL